MSELDEILESKSKKKDKTFAEVEGVPANAHKRQKIREEKAAKKEAEPASDRVIFFTQMGYKIIKVIVKAGGARQVYYDRIRPKLGPVEARKQKEKWDTKKQEWIDQGMWVHPHEYEDKVREAKESLKG